VNENRLIAFVRGDLNEEL